MKKKDPNLIKNIVDLINCGCTWSQISNILGYSEVYLRAELRDKTEGIENKNLLNKVKCNTKLKKGKVAVVTETGYLFDTKGDILDKGLPRLYIPNFCFGEMQKNRKKIDAYLVLSKYKENRTSIRKINTRGKEKLEIYPQEKIKRRRKGIVGLCCYLKRYHKLNVILLTNDKAIKELAEKQGLGIIVVNSRSK